MQKKEVLNILTGNAFLYYCFDVGTHIDLNNAETRLGSSAQRAGLIIERLTPSAVHYRKNPLLVRLGQRKITNSYTLEITAKLYDFGVITIRVRAPLHGVLDNKLCMSLQNNKHLNAAAKAAFEEIHTKLADAIERPYELTEAFEDYTIVHIERFSRNIKASELFSHHATEIARLLRCEGQPLSHQELNDAIKNPLSYYDDDLVVIDTGAAFVYYPRHEYDVNDVIEYAIIRLLELRHYDGVLDGVLEQAHKDISATTLRLRPYSQLHRQLAHVRVQVTNTVEKVENALKLIGDSYLAKIYDAAADRFGLKTWKDSVREKLTTLQETYAMLTERIQSRRLMMLEVVIAISSVIFIIDFVWRYWKR